MAQVTPITGDETSGIPGSDSTDQLMSEIEELPSNDVIVPDSAQPAALK